MNCFPFCHTSEQLSGTPGGRAVTDEREEEEGLPAVGSVAVTVTSGLCGRARDIDPMLLLYWADVLDAGPTMSQSLVGA